MLKQPQSNPLSLEKQILSLFAGTQGYLDELSISEIPAFENTLHKVSDYLKYFSVEYSFILNNLNTDSDEAILHGILQHTFDLSGMAQKGILFSLDYELEQIHSIIF